MLVTAKRPTAQKPAALPAIPSIIVAPKYTEDDADDQEDLFAELDTAAEIARVVAQQPPPQKKARVEEVRVSAPSQSFAVPYALPVLMPIDLATYHSRTSASPRRGPPAARPRGCALRSPGRDRPPGEA